MTLPYRPRCDCHAPPASNASIYHQLHDGEIRLVELGAYNEQGMLKTYMHNVRLADLPEYSAISYTWSEEDQIWYEPISTAPTAIWVDRKLVQVSNKVANILCHSKQMHSQIVWIDALCINQADDSEKSLQVAQMGKIYSTAKHVLCYVGSPSLHTDQLMDCAALHAIGIPQKASYDMMRYYRQLLSSVYWSRAWTLQERCLAKAEAAYICCGSRAVTLPTLLHWILELEDHHKSLSVREKLVQGWDIGTAVLAWGFKAKLPTSWIGVGLNADSDALAVMEISRFIRGCFDPRDLIYSRLALSSHFARLVPCPDYTLGTAEVYTRFAAAYILDTRNLKILTLATSTDLLMPSWVTDWQSYNDDWGLPDRKGRRNDSMSRIAQLPWKDNELPAVTRDCQELVVQARFLYIWRYDFTLALSGFLFRGLKGRGRGYAATELPTSGDKVFLLKGCPTVVFLRLVHEHYIVVGRNTFSQQEAYDTRDIVENIKVAGIIPEVVVRIR